MNSEPRPIPTTRSQAIVIGGSMAGLLAARALANHFTEVTIIERDRFPEEPVGRKGVPQARHVHVLLNQGKRQLERFFPGLEQELVERGVPVIDLAADFRLINFAGERPRFPSDLQTYSCTRDLLEWTVRRRLARSCRIRFLQDREVVGLVHNGRAVCGVRSRLRAPSAGETAEEEHVADLVVDASGRGSRAPEWLESLGYSAPREKSINAFLGYATRWYRRPAGYQADWTAMLQQASPPCMRGGVIMPVEEDRWLVTLAGSGRDYPPTDEEGFMAFAQSLPDLQLYEAMRAGEPLTNIVGYRRTENRLRYYEALTRRPERFLVMGDAVCAFNPIYGQGMTVAALGAATLDHCVREQRRRHSDGSLVGLAQHFQKDLAVTNKLPWLLATGEDFRVPETEGGRADRLTLAFRMYTDAVQRVGARNPATHLAFLQVLHMIKPPTALFHPRIMAAVAGRAMKEQPIAGVYGWAGSTLSVLLAPFPWHAR